MNMFCKTFVVLGISVATAGAAITTTKIVDKDTVKWGGTGTFGTAVVFSSLIVDGGDLTFGAANLTGLGSVYKRTNGTGYLVANNSTLIPDGTGSFTAFDRKLGLSDGDVVFSGEGSSGQFGVYSDSSGLNKIMNGSTLVPGETFYFTDADLPSIHYGDIAFRGVSSGGNGVYLYDGSTISVIADYDTTIPPANTAYFDTIVGLAYSNGYTAFIGADSSGNYGIYLDNGSSLICIADYDTAIPGGTGNFTWFKKVQVDSNGNVVFGGDGSSRQRGIYKYSRNTSTLSLIADRDTTLPGISSVYSSVGYPSYDGSNVAFFGIIDRGPPYVPLKHSLLVDYDGHLINICKGDEKVDGIDILQFGDFALSGNKITLSFSGQVNNDWVGFSIYEFEFCPGDINGDGFINLSDLAILLANLDNPGSREDGDINGDGMVDSIDQAILLDYYNESCP